MLAKMYMIYTDDNDMLGKNNIYLDSKDIYVKSGLHLWIKYY